MGNPPVFVVGDSISAGMGGESVTWPRLLVRRQQIVVHDLSLMGATVASAGREQAGHVAEPVALVLAEIGGNDLLGGTAPEDFERGLETLLSRLRSRGWTVVLLELPLPP